MKKTLNINIAGQLFRIDEETCQILSHYLEQISARFRREPGGEETISDIETRIAEILGGGSEPPKLVSRDMVDRMIDIMGAPEDYNEDRAMSEEAAAGSYQSMHDLGHLFSRAGKMLYPARKVFGTVLSRVIRILAVVLGTLFTIVGFVLLLAFVLLFFFTDTPMMKEVLDQEIQNLPMLLSLALNGNMVQMVCLLAAIVILIPLASMVYVGIKLIFKIRQGSKPLRMVTFITWLFALCGLAVLLTLKLSVYANHDQVSEKQKLETPPKTLWIAPMKKITEAVFDEQAAAEYYVFWRNSTTGQLFGTVDLNIYSSDSTAGWLSVTRTAFSKSESGAWSNARKIGFSWKVSRDTLYLDEFYSLPEHSNWNGSSVVIDLSLPEGTVIKSVAGCHLASWHFRVHDPEATTFRLEQGRARVLKDVSHQ